MAVNIIPNQLIQLVPLNGEDQNELNHRLMWDYRNYCQVVRTEQTTMFQVQLTPETGENIIPNGDFDDSTVYLANWNLLSGTGQAWNGLAVIRSFGVPFADIQQTVNVEQNSYYYIEFEVQDITPNSQVVVSVLPTPDYGNFAALAANEPGTYRFYFKSLSSTTASIDITLTGALRPQVNMEFVNMIKMSYPAVTVKTCETETLVRTVLPIDVQEDRANYAIDWYGLDYGCYRICLSGIDDLTYNYLAYALALGAENGAPLMMEDGGFINWFG